MEIKDMAIDLSDIPEITDFSKLVKTLMPKNYASTGIPS